MTEAQTPQQTGLLDEPAGTIRWHQDDDGVVVLTLDDPDQATNTMNQRYVQSMGQVLDRLEAHRDRITGVVLTSAKKTFFAGGDLIEMSRVTPADAEAVYALVELIKAQLRRLETLGRPVVAALGGAALGGGLELALACHHRIAVDDPHTRLGFPEVTLGLLPGAGGVTRSVRMFGIQTALTELLLRGQRLRPGPARDLGLVDQLVATADELLPAAKAWIAANPAPAQPWDRPGAKIPGGTPSSPAVMALLPMLAATVRKQLKGANLPAPRAIMAAAVEGAAVDLDTALRIESRYLVELLTGPVAQNMIKGFFLDLQHIRSGGSRPSGYPRSEPARVAVLGAGMMGAGIGYVCAKAGLDVVLKDVTVAAAQAGKGYSAGLLERAVERGRMSTVDAAAVLARITGTDRAEDLAGADLVIEAVFEDPAVKDAALREAQAVAAPGALLASNTSTLPITALAGSVTRPADFIGLHFFSPVDKMPLLEIVVGEQTSDATVARAVDFAARIGKTPIVVNDSRGFFTSRVIGRRLEEAVRMIADGVPAPSVEQAGNQAGYPAPPLQLLDELTLTLPRRIRAAQRDAVLAAGGTWDEPPSAAVFDAMIDEYGRPGRSGGAGFYEYVDGRRAGLWPGLREHFGTGTGTGAGGGTGTGDRAVPPLADLIERLLFIEALESVRCLDSGVLRSVPDANVGSLLGIGFPPWTGGVLQYITGYAGGLPGFVARAWELASRYGNRFAPPQSLEERAGAGVVFA